MFLLKAGESIPHQEFLQINTAIFSLFAEGPLDGLEEVVAKRLESGTSRLGFLAGGPIEG